MIAVVLLGLMTPVCAMAACKGMTSCACSDFKPTCGDCPSQTIMKHTQDDAVCATPTCAAHLGVVGQTVVSAVPTVDRALEAPRATASPPPLEPLGVRLTI